MLKKDIAYIDYNGNERVETCYFNLTRAELAEYDAQFAAHGGIIEYLTMLTKTNDTNKLVQAFKDLILRSYGEKTASGRFIKTQELRDAFMVSEPYSELFFEITNSQESAEAFINGLIAKVPAKNPQAVAPAIG